MGHRGRCLVDVGSQFVHALCRRSVSPLPARLRQIRVELRGHHPRLHRAVDPFRGTFPGGGMAGSPVWRSAGIGVGGRAVCRRDDAHRHNDATMAVLALLRRDIGRIHGHIPGIADHRSHLVVQEASGCRHRVTSGLPGVWDCSGLVDGVGDLQHHGVQVDVLDPGDRGRDAAVLADTVLP